MLLLKNIKFIITQDEKRRILENCDLLVEKGKIKKIEKNIKVSQKVKVFDCQKGILLPALFNLHTHLSMTLFRGFKDYLPLHQWLKEIWKKEVKLTPQDIKTGSEIGIKELLSNGTAGFLDMYFFPKETAKIAKRFKIKAMLGEPVISILPIKLNEIIKETKNLCEKYRNDPFIKICVNPHSIYTVSKNDLIKLKNFAKKNNLFFHLHLSETEKEVKECQRIYKKRPVEFLDEIGILDEKTILAHVIWITEKEVKILKKRKVKVVSCPQSNLKLASGIFNFPLFKKYKIKICLGTDGPASNNSLNMFEEMKVFSLLQKGFFKNPTLAQAQEVLDMATINGGEIFGKTGRIKKGYSADFVLLSSKNFSFFPLKKERLLSHIVFSKPEVLATIVEGEISFSKN